MAEVVAATAPTVPIGRVALVLLCDGVGGTETKMALLAEGLAERGVQVDVLLLRNGSRPHAFAGCRVLVVGPRRLVGATPLVALPLARALRRGRYDVAHAAMAQPHTLVPFLAPAGTAVVAWRANLGIHSEDRPLRRWLERRASRHTDLLIANSARVATYWRARTDRRTRVVVVPNCIAEDRFEQLAPVDVPGAGPLIVSVGNLRPVKRHDLLLYAAARLRERGIPVRVVILGEGELRGELTRLAAELAVPLLLPGHVPDTRGWLAAADVVAHTSESEGASNAVAEAVAAGRPVVCTRVGDAEEVLDPAWIVEVGDLDGLVERLDAALRGTAGPAAAAALERLRSSRTIPVFVDQHLSYYHEAIASRKESRVRHRRQR